MATQAATRDGVHNVRTTYLFTFFFWAARSILFQQIISGFVFVLMGSNGPVGVVKGVQGIAQLLCSYPAGYLADHSRRDRVLRYAGSLGLVAALLTCAAVLLCHYALLVVAFALWGLFAALQSPAMESLFAESVPHGRRSYPFMIKYNVSNVAQVVGPLLSVLLFLYVGDSWRVQELQPVLVFGTFLVAIASLVLFRFDDDCALAEELTTLSIQRPDATARSQSQSQSHSRRRRSTSIGSDALKTPSVGGDDLEIEFDFPEDEDPQNDERQEPQHPKTHRTATACSVPTETSSLLLAQDDPRAKTDSALSFLEHALLSDRGDASISCLGFTPRHVPLLLFLSDFIISNGAGLTVYFFPLFFKEEYGLSPIHVSLVLLAQPIVVMVLAYVAQRSSRAVGRMPLVAFTRLASTVCLLGLSYAQPLPLAIALFLLRGGMMRCSQPLRRSVLMDHVEKQFRARWNALEGISVFSYSGSAVLGGYLVDRYDYRTCFFITSFVYFVGLSLELVLIPLTRHAVEA
ncbi:hypothetical protein ATCC90586_003981 [Pythium insidiosum]|nr:hypothetical protein ATCC90586_003981 [Pythium insidiosum]